MALAQPGYYTEEEYYNLPEEIRAELIDGKIYNMAAPSREHQEILGNLYYTIRKYIDSQKGNCKVYPAPFAAKLFENDNKTVVEPDISVICDSRKLTDRGCTGAPDWIIEIISPSTAGRDYIRKLHLYANAGVREYWIVNPIQKSLYVYHLEETQFETMAYTFQDKVKTGIFPDLWIDFQELAG